jgi:hypothetical protein
MSVITMSATVAGLVVDWAPGQLRFDTMERSDSTGDEAARLLAPPRWSQSVTFGEHRTLAESGAIEAFLLQLRGGVNVAAIYDPIRTEPTGGITGTLKLVGDVPAGATSMVLTGADVNALGFDPGDLFTIGSGVGTSHHAKVVADADPSGSGGAFTWTGFTWTSFSWIDANYITVTFEPPTRRAFAQGTAVTIVKPLAYYRMQGAPRWKYSTQAYRRSGGAAADFVETFSA